MPAKKITALFFILLFVAGIAKLISCNTKTDHSIVSSNGDSATLELGRYLFYDRRLSVNNTRSCGTCHNPQFAFTDGYKRSLGVFADLHLRNTEPLFNLSELKYLTAADSTLHTPLQQMSNPLFNDHPAEMGAKGSEEGILEKIKSDPLYQKLFSNAGMKISWKNIKGSISTFIISLRSFNSKYDRFLKGDSEALNVFEKKGKALFFSEMLKCGKCHGGVNFSTPLIQDNTAERIFYFNTGLYNIDDKGSYPENDQGLFALTKRKADMGKFRVPSLRNLAFTAPYFHDGSAGSLKDVIEIYAAGGRNIQQGEDRGNGIANPYKHSFISGFTISEPDKINLVRFLLSLSDSSFVQDPQYQNPFTSDETKKKY